MTGEHGRDIGLLDMLWAQAEREVYPLVLSEPDAYRRAVTVIRAVADRLAAATTPAQLARAFGGAEALARETGTPMADLDAGALAGAGFRLRYQQILAAAPRAGEASR